MGMESLLVALLVGASSVSAAWTLMPQIARRTLATGLQRLPLPARVNAFLAQAAQNAGGCNCSGCDRASAKGGQARSSAVQGPQALVFHPRQRR
jgi:hypothetical protein